SAITSSTGLIRNPFPRLGLVDGPGYRQPKGTLNSIMATRGCPHNCKFCCVTRMYGKGFRMRPVDEVIAELNLLNDEPIVFADDNLIGNPRYAKELFKAMIPLKKTWGAQLSIKIADDLELLKLAKESGGFSFLFGFESINKDNIEDMNKGSVNNVKKYEECIKIVHDHGFQVVGSFIIGLDHDDENSFDELYEFIVNNDVDIPFVNIFTPLPGSDLFETYKKQDRILTYDWARYNWNHVVSKPKKMTPEQLQEGYDNLQKRLYPYIVKKAMERQRKARKN
ncbi:B12-binding domain-containing radical SAM protein, partial [Spirochaetota bacterium]